MTNPRICLDLDNVLAKTDEVMRRIIRQFTNGNVDLRYMDVTTFNYWECKGEKGNFISKKQWTEIHDIFSKPENILAIEPYPHIQDHLCVIAEMYDLHIVTTRLRPARKPTIEWLDRYKFPDHSLHFVKHGEKHAVLGKFAVSLEDHREQAEQFAAIGTTSYILAHPWNKISSTSTSIRLPDWQTLCERILKN